MIDNSDKAVVKKKNMRIEIKASACGKKKIYENRYKDKPLLLLVIMQTQNDTKQQNRQQIEAFR